MVLFFTHIPFVVNHTINATPPERLQQYSQAYVGFDKVNHSKSMSIATGKPCRKDISFGPLLFFGPTVAPSLFILESPLSTSGSVATAHYLPIQTGFNIMIL